MTAHRHLTRPLGLLTTISSSLPVYHYLVYHYLVYHYLVFTIPSPLSHLHYPISTIPSPLSHLHYPVFVTLQSLINPD
jgi:hypothetical protein